ncbi:MAG: MBL fold metallo-hydrolase [Alphaproteobacteria bacterium]|nr:MBL fold metallo-hydrolase [Alphaproteobacteria bacterium]
MKLSFLGATGTVTGSRYLLEDGHTRVLVDCGLFQGQKELRLRNRAKLPFDPATIDAVLLTHAHVDHSGYLPLLVKSGFRGPIFCSEATFDFCTILLPDCGHIQEEDAERANRYGYSRHKPALPLYTEQDAREALQSFKVVEMNRDYALSDILAFTLIRAGHILGAASVRIDDGLTSVLFSGDIGRYRDAIMPPPAPAPASDYVVMETTYGNRSHIDTDPADKLAEIINRTAERGGTTVIPSFAVGRAQSILYYIHELKRERRIHDIPVFLDSPMAIDATDLFRKHHGEHRLSVKKCAEVCRTATCVHAAAQSKALNEDVMPKIIISASGMAEGGRVLHHMKHYIGNHRNTILFAGYQAAGTRGAHLVSGAKTVRIHGEVLDVRAEIDRLDNLSAHADSDGLIRWLRSLSAEPRRIFLTHGEPDSAGAFQDKIERELGWQAEIPDYGQSVEL